MPAAAASRRDEAELSNATAARQAAIYTALAREHNLIVVDNSRPFAEVNNDSLVDYYLTNNVEGTADRPEFYFENVDGTAFNSVAAARGIVLPGSTGCLVRAFGALGTSRLVRLVQGFFCRRRGCRRCSRFLGFFQLGRFASGLSLLAQGLTLGTGLGIRSLTFQ